MGKLNIPLCGDVTLDLPSFFSPAIERDGGVLTTRLLIGGEWMAATGGEVFEDRSPVDGSLLARPAKASADDVKAAIAAARDARNGFRALPAAARLERALKEVERWPVGDPRAEDTKVGPMVNDKAAARVNQLVEDAVGKGARLLAGGDVADSTMPLPMASAISPSVVASRTPASAGRASAIRSTSAPSSRPWSCPAEVSSTVY